MSNYPPEEFGPSPLRGHTPRTRWLTVYNNSGEGIPPYAVMEVTGVAAHNNGELVFTVDQPTGIQIPAALIFNGPTTIATGAYGRGTQDCPAQVLADPGVTFSVGDRCGPESGEWWLTDAGYAFTVMGVDPTVTPAISAVHFRVIVQRTELGSAFVGKNGSSAIAAMSGTSISSGTVTLYRKSGSSIVSTGATVTAYNMAGEVAADAYVQVKQDAYGTWWVDVEKCEE